MRRFPIAKVLAVCLLLFAASRAAAQHPPSPALELLDHLAGNWVLKGTIAGKQTTHDVEAHWLLRHEYLQIHEVSREKEASGESSYEAIVLVSFDPKADQYTCLWLDSTSGAGLTNGATCKASPTGDSIPFVFILSPTESIHTTFAYRKETDSWRWTIDDIQSGKSDRFADAVLERMK